MDLKTNKRSFSAKVRFSRLDAWLQRALPRKPLQVFGIPSVDILTNLLRAGGVCVCVKWMKVYIVSAGLGLTR